MTDQDCYTNRRYSHHYDPFRRHSYHYPLVWKSDNARCSPELNKTNQITSKVWGETQL